ncbi:MAG: isoleucine--tRNA ligase [Candidatus Kapaibacteriota bacterium]
MFRPLPEKFSYPDLENEVLKSWEEKNIFEKSLDLRKDAPYYTFYEGPPTVNGKPGLHHMMARTIKDTICRYKTMKGFYVRRQAGWDTHGLPVEIQIEKQLGFKNKQEVLDFGIDKFNKVCKDFVYQNIEMDLGWRTLTSRMGYWVDMDTAYITCTNNYIESVWWALKQYFDKGLIYRGFKVVPQSPTIETPLSSHELSLGYKDVRDPNCYLQLKIINSKISGLEDAKIVVWTTTPWTLFANVALAVGVKIDYVLVNNTIKTGDKDNIKVEVKKLVLAKSRLSVLDGEVEILKEFKGEELLGTEYEQIFSYCKIDKTEFTDALTILAGDFVTTENGSGVVHLAPAFGEDDYQMSKKFKIPFLQPVTNNGHFTEEITDFAGRAIKNFTYATKNEAGEEIVTKEEGADKDIVIALKYADKIYRSTNDYLHSYPHCWRTGNPIMYYARESWFIKSPEYKERMIELNNQINWQPSEIGTGRFGNWLEEVKDWSLSRDRFWGTPLPLWVNTEDKEDIIAIGSIEDLKTGYIIDENGNKKSVSELDEAVIDLHRPFVDDVYFERNGATYKRVHEVIDVWFDSGSMPFAQMHYPFENKDLFEKSFPADFIAEGIDQTRGWFYTLHNIATAIFDKPAFKNIVVNELILDKNGVKMSKRLGNTIDPFEIMERLGADAVRWYLYVNNPPWKTTKFDEEDLAKTVISDFFRSLTNTYAFFALYANIDGFDGTEEIIEVKDRPEIDKWILSRLNTVIGNFTNFMEEYELTKAHREIQSFVVDELSNWYIRRNRRRFWKGENDKDKIAAYQTLKEVLLNVTYMMASNAPFLSDYLYTRLKNENDPESVHLVSLPEANKDLIDLDLERKMELAQRVVYISRSLREKSKIRTRQPLKKILIPITTPTQRRDLQSVADIIKEEINIKDIEYVDDKTSNIVSRTAKANFKTLGKKYGKLTNILAVEIKKMSNEDILELESKNKFIIKSDGVDYEIEFSDIEISSQDIEGWLVATERGVTVALDTFINDELRNEGNARELVNRIQNMRKDNGYEVTDRINIYLGLDNSKDAKMIESVNTLNDYIKSETLAQEIVISEINSNDETYNKVELDEDFVYIKLQKL